MSEKQAPMSWELCKGKIAKALASLIPKAIAFQIIHAQKEKTPFQNISFSQEGEDMLLYSLMDVNKAGLYVDIGAHHPTRLSNTHKLYLAGWSGINIDPTPGVMIEFNKIRKRDINLELAISNKAQNLEFYLFDEPALNTFDKQKAETIVKNSNFKIIDQKEIATVELKDILNKHVPERQVIDFMNIDVENLELDVLKSNDWEKFKPKLLLIENTQNTLEDVLNSSITSYLNDLGYTPIAKGLRTVFYRLNS
jgi:FkbM family methyltransferase